MNITKNSNTLQLTYTGLLTALVFVVTFSIKLPTPFTNGYIHPGDSMVFLAAIILDFKYAIFAAGFGSMLSDLAGGYYQYLIPTLIIKALMALIVNLTMKKDNNKLSTTVILGTLASGIWISFLAVLKYLMRLNINVQSDYLINEIEDINSLPELLSLHDKVQSQLMVAAVLIPIFIFVVIAIINKKVKYSLSINSTLGITIAGLFMVIGYYFTGYILSGNYIIPTFSVPMNIIQFVVGYLIALIVYSGLSKLRIPGLKLN